jgi:hypothetical protein
MIGVLTTISEELKDVPFYYQLPDLASTVHSKVPLSIEFQSALANAGYRMSQFHHEPLAVKTDAPPQVVSVSVPLFHPHLPLFLSLTLSNYIGVGILHHSYLISLSSTSFHLTNFD